MTYDEKQLLLKLFQDMSVRVFKWCYGDIKKFSGGLLSEEIQQTCTAMSQADYTGDMVWDFMETYAVDHETIFSPVADTGKRVVDFISDFVLDEWLREIIDTYIEVINAVFGERANTAVMGLPIDTLYRHTDITSRYWGPIVAGALNKCMLLIIKQHTSELPISAAEATDEVERILDYVESMGNMEYEFEEAKYYLPWVTSMDRLSFKSKYYPTDNTLIDTLRSYNEPLADRLVTDIYKCLPFIDDFEYNTIDYVPISG